MWKVPFEIFIKSLRFKTPKSEKKGFYESICTQKKDLIEWKKIIRLKGFFWFKQKIYLN